MIRVLIFLMPALLILLDGSTVPSMEHWPDTTVFLPGVAAGALDNSEIDEASGLVASRRNPGKLWTHNDSGDVARIFLIAADGKWQATVHLQGTTNRDWEDIAIGPGPREGVPYIYVADIGDNMSIYSTKYLYRIEEPVIPPTVKDTTIAQVDKIPFTLEDGERDAEALVVDPDTGEVYVFSKRDLQIGLYSFDPMEKAPSVAKKLYKLPYTQVVAADIAPDNAGLLIKTYDSVYYWANDSHLPVEELVKQSPETEPYVPEPQGEGIAFGLDGGGYFTISEQTLFGNTPILYYYKKRLKSD